MSRAPGPNAKYAQVHWESTNSRLRSPIKKVRWTNSHLSQARNPPKQANFEIGDRLVAADRSHRTFIEIAKWFGLVASNKEKNVLGGMPAHLHRCRTHSRQGLTGLTGILCNAGSD